MDATDQKGEPKSPNEDVLPKSFLRSKHIHFVLELQDATDTLEYYLVEHMKMEALYWSLACLDLLDSLDKIPCEKVVVMVKSYYHPEVGAFGANVDHDPDLIPTLNAIQVLALVDKLHVLDTGSMSVDKIVSYIVGLQKPDGSFQGNKWGEVDSRFSYSALCALALLGRLDDCNTEKATEWLDRCRNFDGGYGTHPGAESHSGQVFCCVGALAILNRLDLVDVDSLGWWLSERQLICGGLNGRPEKLEDVCYSWWVLSGMAVMKRIHWIDGKKLRAFILTCQDADDGGISDRPGNTADVYHTYFGIAGLSLLGDRTLKEINPLYALPSHVIKRLGLQGIME